MVFLLGPELKFEIQNVKNRRSNALLEAQHRWAQRTRRQGPSLNINCFIPLHLYEEFYQT